MKNISLLKYVKEYIEDEYAMNVFYYSIKKMFYENDFSLADVDASMIDTGLYAKDDAGVEYVLAMFTHDSTPYCAMIATTQEDNDVICGTYEAVTQTDENGIDWTLLDFNDVYTGQSYEIGFAEADGECLILDQEGNAYQAEYLSADDTITYFGTAAALAEN